MPDPLGAVVLAAGSGRRIGTPKLRLEVEGRSYLGRILAQLVRTEIGPVVIVVAAAEEDWARNLVREENRFSDPRPKETPARQHGAGSALLVNPHPEQGMFSSIRLGVAALMECAGLLIVPVDHPFVADSTIIQLKHAFLQNPAAVIKAAFHGRAGHPIIIPQAVFQTVLAAGPDASLRELLRTAAVQRLSIEVDDEGILRNINERGDMEG